MPLNIKIMYWRYIDWIYLCKRAFDARQCVYLIEQKLHRTYYHRWIDAWTARFSCIRRFDQRQSSNAWLNKQRLIARATTTTKSWIKDSSPVCGSHCNGYHWAYKCCATSHITPVARQTFPIIFAFLEKDSLTDECEPWIEPLISIWMKSACRSPSH